MLYADSYSSIYVGQSLVSMVSPQSGFDLLLVAIVILVKIPLGFPPKLKTEVAKMVGCMLCATLHSKHAWENLTASLRSFNSYFFLPYYVFSQIPFRDFELPSPVAHRTTQAKRSFWKIVGFAQLSLTPKILL